MGIEVDAGEGAHVGPASDSLDAYTGYRVVYHLDRFTAGWRTLVVFYLAMFIAGYAQVLIDYVFWGAFSALVIMFWEPYLAPPYPWTSDGPAECLSRVQPWGNRPAWLPPADAQETQAVRQWVYAVRRGLNKSQSRAYKVLLGLIALPCASVWVGVVMQTTSQFLNDNKAVYSSALLVALMTIYTVLTWGSMALFQALVRPRLQRLTHLETPWKPHDMMFFTCKILGETLNTTVQTLVAGAFVSYMSDTVFWLCIAITGMSYTATNLLYGFGPGSPVVEDPEPAPGPDPEGPCAAPDPEQPVLPSTRSAPAPTRTWRRAGSSAGAAGASIAATAAGKDPRRVSGGGAAGPMHAVLVTVAGGEVEGSAGAADAVCDFDDDGVTLERDSGAPATDQGGMRRRARAGPGVGPDGAMSKAARPVSPPFLVYRRPKGLRGWSIIGLLIGVSAPSTALLVLLAHNVHKHTSDSRIFLDPEHTCSKNPCYSRYKQMLILLCSLGFAITYYAITLGFLGSGPVTWVYRMVNKARASRQRSTPHAAQQ